MMELTISMLELSVDSLDITHIVNTCYKTDHYCSNNLFQTWTLTAVQGLGKAVVQFTWIIPGALEVSTGSRTANMIIILREIPTLRTGESTATLVSGQFVSMQQSTIYACMDESSGEPARGPQLT